MGGGAPPVALKYPHVGIFNTCLGDIFSRRGAYRDAGTNNLSTFIKHFHIGFLDIIMILNLEQRTQGRHTYKKKFVFLVVGPLIEGGGVKPP